MEDFAGCPNGFDRGDMLSTLKIRMKELNISTFDSCDDLLCSADTYREACFVEIPCLAKQPQTPESYAESARTTSQ
jgi:hypothetical protein